jgi:hypothetical protein
MIILKQKSEKAPTHYGFMCDLCGCEWALEVGTDAINVDEFMYFDNVPKTFFVSEKCPYCGLKYSRKAEPFYMSFDLAQEADD